MAGRIEGKAEGGFGVGQTELEGGVGLEFGGNVALGLDEEFAVRPIEAERGIGLDGVGVFAGEGFELGGGGCGDLGWRCGLGGMRQRPCKSGCTWKQSEAKGGEGNATAKQGKNLLK
jgi:hypothetical protein